LFPQPGVARPIGGRMTLPRPIVPGEYYLITRRCTQRQFLLRPDDATNNAFVYCLAEAAERFGIEVILPVAMSNHYHAVVRDVHGRLPQFTEHFHKMLAKCVNALRGRWENMWSSEQVCVVRLVDAADIMRKLVYVATNPVKDHLVGRADHWPGFNGFTYFVNRRSISARRPAHFFRADGRMPLEVTLELTIPEKLGAPEDVIRELEALVSEAETKAAAERRTKGVHLVGRAAIRKQTWRDTPITRERRRNLRPTIAAKSVWSRQEAILRDKEFIADYREARLRWKNGDAAVFPAGTYWLRRHASVPLTA
jgi:putative transposase